MSTTASDTTTSTGTSTGTSSAPPLAGIHHVGLTVTDVDRSEAWYTAVLGWQRLFVEPHHESDEEGYAVVLGHPDYGFNIGIEHHPANDGGSFDPRTTGLDHLCFAVPDLATLAAWAEHLDRLGIANSGVYPIEGTPYSIISFDDPDGIQLELIVQA